jgi:tRNA(Ile2) C34 agmatinyltransferase TiaS
MNLYQVNGLKKISVSKLLEAYKDEEIICPHCGEFIDLNYNLGEFENKKTGYKSVEYNHCFKIIGIKFYDE